MLAHEQVGLVFDVQRFCTHDGPGIRTTVFLKGCPLHCAWCHNPESQKRYPELLFTPALCIECDSCRNACPNEEGRLRLEPGQDREGCEDCLRCAEVCPGGAIEVAGRPMKVGELLDQVLKDRIFFEESGGGVTLSGGEPLAQFAFSHAFFRTARSVGIHTCIETSGYAPLEFYEDIAPFVDVFLWDIKDTDAARHKRWTGVSNERIIENLYRVDALGRTTRLRCLLIAGVNDNASHARAVARLAASLRCCKGIDVLPYHGCGRGKLESLGRMAPPEEFVAPEENRIAEFRGWLRAEGLHAA